MKKIILAASAAALLALSGASFAADAAAGKAKSAVCAGCHGATGQGNAAAGFPKLAGQSPADLEAKLKAFRSGTRKNPTMNAMAGGLSDADIANLAAYFGSLK